MAFDEIPVDAHDSRVHAAEAPAVQETFEQAHEEEDGLLRLARLVREGASGGMGAARPNEDIDDDDDVQVQANEHRTIGDKATPSSGTGSAKKRKRRAAADVRGGPLRKRAQAAPSPRPTPRCDDEGDDDGGSGIGSGSGDESDADNANASAKDGTGPGADPNGGDDMGGDDAMLLAGQASAGGASDVVLTHVARLGEGVEAVCRPTPSGTGVEVTLETGDCLCFTGSVVVHVVSGILDVFGARATPQTGPLEVHSPEWLPGTLLPLRPWEDDDAQQDGVVDRLASLLDVAVTIRLSSCASAYLTKGARRVQAGKAAANGHLGRAHRAFSRLCTRSIRGFNPVFARSGTGDCSRFAPVVVSDELKRAVDSLFPVAPRAEQSLVSAPDAAMQRRLDIRVVLCGPRNLGKSVSARYTVNRLLSRYSKVAFLDVDVGQSEFTPPGFVSLSIVTQPLLGPNFTHLMSPECAHFVGSLSPADVPDLYGRSVVSCMDFFTSSYAAGMRAELVPLVVNTHGWTTGMGLDMICDTIRCVEPTHVMHFALHMDSMSYSERFMRFRDAACGAPVIAIPAPHKSRSGAEHYFDLTNNQESRQLSFAAYFSAERRFTMDSIAQVLASVPPYAVPWDSIHVSMTAANVDPQEALLVLNGSFVGLCHDPGLELLTGLGDGAGRQAGPALRVLSPEYARVATPRCFGLGLVRAIDPAARMIYIVTPVDVSLCPVLNVLCRGSMPVPPTFSFQGSVQDAPYITFGHLSGTGRGAGKMQSRSNIKRLRLS